jgi:hypothetical protein
LESDGRAATTREDLEVDVLGNRGTGGRGSGGGAEDIRVDVGNHTLW